MVPCQSLGDAPPMTGASMAEFVNSLVPVHPGINRVVGRRFRFFFNEAFKAVLKHCICQMIYIYIEINI